MHTTATATATATTPLAAPHINLHPQLSSQNRAVGLNSFCLRVTVCVVEIKGKNGREKISLTLSPFLFFSFSLFVALPLCLSLFLFLFLCNSLSFFLCASSTLSRHLIAISKEASMEEEEEEKKMSRNATSTCYRELGRLFPHFNACIYNGVHFT